MKKRYFFGTALAAVLFAGVTCGFAASDPSDDVSSYGYKAGQSKYVVRQVQQDSGAESLKARERIRLYSQLPENPTDAQLREFYEKHKIGRSPAYSNGKFDENGKAGYGFNKASRSLRSGHPAIESKAGQQRARERVRIFSHLPENPTDAQLREFYEKHKADRAAAYAERQRVRDVIGSFSQLPDDPTDAQLREFYEKHKTSRGVKAAAPQS